MNRILFFASFLLFISIPTTGIILVSHDIIHIDFLLPLFVLDVLIIFGYLTSIERKYNKEKKRNLFDIGGNSMGLNIYFFWPFSYFNLRRIYSSYSDKKYYITKRPKKNDIIRIYRDDVLCFKYMTAFYYENVEILKKHIKEVIEKDNTYKEITEEIEEDKYKDLNQWNGAVDKVSNRDKIVKDIT